jgi:hypothetical protein
MGYAIPNGKVVELMRRRAGSPDVNVGYGLGVLPQGAQEQEQRWWLKDRTPDLWFPNIDHYLKIAAGNPWGAISTIAGFQTEVSRVGNFDNRSHLWVKGFARLATVITGQLPVATLPAIQDPNLDLWGPSQSDIGLTQIRIADVMRGQIFTKQLDRSASVEYWFLNSEYDFELQGGTSPDLIAVKSGEHFSELRRSGWSQGSFLASTTCRYCTAVV